MRRILLPALLLGTLLAEGCLSNGAEKTSPGPDPAAEFERIVDKVRGRAMRPTEWVRQQTENPNDRVFGKWHRDIKKWSDLKHEIKKADSWASTWVGVITVTEYRYFATKNKDHYKDGDDWFDSEQAAIQADVKRWVPISGDVLKEVAKYVWKDSVWVQVEGVTYYPFSDVEWESAQEGYKKLR